MSMVGTDASFGGLGGHGGFGFGGGGLGAVGLVGLIGLDGLRGRRDGDGDSNCANARFLALENGISQTQDMIANQNVLGAIKDAATNSALRFDAVQNNINSLSTQSLLAGERTNGNIAEVKFQNALNFQSLGKQLGDCCCSIEKTIMETGAKTNALIESINVQNLRDKLGATTLELSQCKQDEKWLILSSKLDGFSKDVANNNVNFGTQISQITTALNSLQAKG